MMVKVWLSCLLVVVLALGLTAAQSGAMSAEVAAESSKVEKLHQTKDKTNSEKILDDKIGKKGDAVKAAAPAALEPVEPPSIVLPVINLDNLLPPKPESDVPEPPPEPSFGSHLLDWLMQNAKSARNQLDDGLPTLVAWPALEKWWDQQQQPKIAERWTALLESGGRILLWGFGVALALHFLLLPLRRNMRVQQEGQKLTGRLALGLGVFALDCVPVIAFLVVGLTQLADSELTVRVRMVLQAGIYAAIFARVLLMIGKLLLAPRHGFMRLIPVDDVTANSLGRWLIAVTLLAAGGTWLLDAARLLEMPVETSRSGARVLGALLLLCLIGIVRQSRVPVATWLRGQRLGNTSDLLSWARHNLATLWHRLTIAYLLIGYTVTVMSGGFSALLQGTFTTLFVILAMSLLLYGLNQLSLQAAAAQARDARLPLHQPALLTLLRLWVSVGGVYLILLGWNVDFSAWMKTDLVQRLTGAAFSVSIAIILAVLAYEILCSLQERARQRQATVGRGSSSVDRAARMQTLHPLIRNSAAVALGIAVALIGLAEIGVNISPLLAGAGIVGVAVGFGSQALVKDIITGLFIIIEDTIHIGDVITCGTHSGAVETMTIRTLRLRDVNGNLHVLPYSEVVGFINQTRGFAFAVMEIGVAYDTELRRAFTVMAEVGEALRQDGEIGPNILAAPEINGILSFGDYSIIIRVRIKTLPGQQWAVRFAYMLAIKERFDAEGIRIPFPTVTHQVQRTDLALLPSTPELPPQLIPASQSPA